MNVSQISFCGRQNNEYEINHSQLSQKAAATRAQLRQSSNLQADTYEFSTRPTKKKPLTKEQQIVKEQTRQSRHRKLVNENSFLRLLSLGLITTTLTSCLNSQPTETPDAVTINPSYGTSLSQIAEIYGSDEDIIIEANNLEDNKVPYNARLVIPSKYTQLEDEIKELQNELYSPDLKADKRQEIESKILELQNKQYIQEQIAQAYTDGEFVYFKITLPTDETASNIQSSYNGAINVESFKEIFNIEKE